MRILIFFLLLYSNFVLAQIQKRVTLLQPSAVEASAGSDKQIVSGNSVVIGGVPTALNGSPGYTYLWLPSVGLNNNTIANPVAAPVQTTTYIVTVTDNKGCTDIDTTIITVLPAGIEDNFYSDNFQIAFHKNSGILFLYNNSDKNFGKLRISVFNILGQTLSESVFSGIPANGFLKINFSDNPQGAYIMRIDNSKQLIIKKFTTN